MKKFLPAVAAAALYFSTPAMADDGTLGDCIKAALAKQKGDFVKVEYLSKSAKGVPTFELELRDANGVEHGRARIHVRRDERTALRGRDGSGLNRQTQSSPRTRR